MRVDRAVVRVDRGPVDRVEELGAREHASWLTNECRQELDLGARELHRALTRDHAHAVQVHCDVARANEATRLGGELAAPEDGADARDDLLRAERLHDVVICAELKADEPVRLLTAGGKDDERHARALAEAPDDVEAVHVRQAEIEDDEVGTIPLRDLERTAPVDSLDRAESRPVEVVADDAKDLGLVLDDEDGPQLASFPGAPGSCSARCHSPDILGPRPPLRNAAARAGQSPARMSPKTSSTKRNGNSSATSAKDPRATAPAPAAAPAATPT